MLSEPRANRSQKGRLLGGGASVSRLVVVHLAAFAAAVAAVEFQIQAVLQLTASRSIPQKDTTKIDRD